MRSAQARSAQARARLRGGEHRRWAPVVRRAAMRVASGADVTADVQDLCREGLAAVAQALADARTFAPDEELESYVVHRIRGAMLEVLQRGSPAAREALAASREVARAMRILSDRSGSPAPAAEIAAALSLSPEAYEALLERIASSGVFRLTPLAAGVRDDGTARELELAGAIDALPELERDVVALVYEAEVSISEAAGVLGASPRTAVVLLSQALHRLRATLGDA